MEDYQLRKDIDRFKYFLDQLEAELQLKYNISDLNLNEWFEKYYDQSQIDEFLSGKADVVHGHEMSDVTGLESSFEGIESSLEDIESELDGKVDVTVWETLMDSQNIKLQKNGIHRRLIIYNKTVDVTSSWKTLYNILGHNNVTINDFPPRSISRMGSDEYAFALINNTESDVHGRLRFKGYGETNSGQVINQVLEWTV